MALHSYGPIVMARCWSGLYQSMPGGIIRFRRPVAASVGAVHFEGDLMLALVLLVTGVPENQ